jgi:hypothetical protein
VKVDQVDSADPAWQRLGVVSGYEEMAQIKVFVESAPVVELACQPGKFTNETAFPLSEASWVKMDCRVRNRLMQR